MRASEIEHDDAVAWSLEDTHPWQECEWDGGHWEWNADGSYYFAHAEKLPLVQWDGECFVCRREMLCLFDCRAVSRLHGQRRADARLHADADNDGCMCSKLQL